VVVGLSGRQNLVGRASVIASLLVAHGCGDDGVSADGSVDAAEEDAGIAIAPPDIPWLADGVPPIAFTPCPDGWREVETGGVTTCDPYPEAGPMECPSGEAHFPGEPGCAPIGEPCPSGDYADSLPADSPVVYVRADAPATGAMGTIDAPYATLGAVPWLSLAGTTVALAKGSYEGTMALSPTTRVVGACVAETILTGAATPATAVVATRSAGEAAYVGNLAIVAPPQAGVLTRHDQSLELEGVLVERAEAFAIGVSEVGSSVSARSLVVRGMGPDDLGRYGRAVWVESGARFEGSRLLFEDNREVAAFSTGGELVLSDVVLRATREQAADGTKGMGIAVQEGARLEATRLLVEGNLTAGVYISGSDATISDAVVRGTREEARTRADGRGIGVQDGASLEASRLLVDDNRGIGIGIWMSEMVASDLVVRGTRGHATDGRGGRGIGVEEGSRFEASELLVDDNRDVSLLAFASDVLVTDAVVRGTRERASDGGGGNGVDVENEARLEANRLLVDDNRSIGIGAYQASEVSLTDTLVRGTEPEEGTLFYGWGVHAQFSSRISGARVSIDGARELGLTAAGSSTVELDGVTIANVEQTASSMPNRVSGHAVSAIDGTVSLTNFHIHDATTCGLLVARSSVPSAPPSLDVSSGIVERTSIGACVQIDEYDLSRLMQDVRYRDNETSLASTNLPVPEPPPALEP
jgi:hypothetical protein